MSRTTKTGANAALAIPRKLLNDYLREAASQLARRREIVGTRIREAREAAGLKQKQLAARVHVEPQTVSNWERSVSVPDLDKVELLAEVLDRPISYFYADPGDNGAAPGDQERVSRLESQVEEALDLLYELVGRSREQPGSAQGSRSDDP